MPAKWGPKRESGENFPGSGGTSLISLASNLLWGERIKLGGGERKGEGI